jgi:flavin-binding protein dodecin
MPNHVYKHLELTGSSPKSIDDAVKNAIAKASKTIRNMDWFNVKEMRGQITKGKLAHWQVTIEIGFRIED